MKTKQKSEIPPKSIKATKVRKIESNLSGHANTIVRPHITEKAAQLAEKGTYVFEVMNEANKIQIGKAIEVLYGVRPVRVNIINLPNLHIVVRGKKGMRSGVRKALVKLKAGDKIDIM